MKQRMIIVIGPSGVGKSSFVERAISELPYLVDIITYTTRNLRPGETEGNPYHFVSRQRFQQLVEENFFVEWAHVHSNCYGSPRDQIEQAWQSDKAVIMDLDVQGAMSCMKEYPGIMTLFILPPSINALRHRVIGRSGRLPEDFDLRMENAKKEMALADQFRVQLINDDFEPSYIEFKKIIEDYWENG